jgi:hypothetical protein
MAFTIEAQYVKRFIAPLDSVVLSVVVFKGEVALMTPMSDKSNIFVPSACGMEILETLYCSGGNRAANSPVFGSVVILMVWQLSPLHSDGRTVHIRSG